MSRKSQLPVSCLNGVPWYPCRLMTVPFAQYLNLITTMRFCFQELETMTRYTSPVNPAVFPHLTVVLLAIGMFFTAWFFVYPFSARTLVRDFMSEVCCWCLHYMSLTLLYSETISICRYMSIFLYRLIGRLMNR